jgi:hypothetical protein
MSAHAQLATLLSSIDRHLLLTEQQFAGFAESARKIAGASADRQIEQTATAVATTWESAATRIGIIRSHLGIGAEK